MKRPLSILVVDDDVDNAMSLSELFQLEGHRVQVAHDGLRAIEAYETASFDIAFMDIMMPGKNGVESFLEIKRKRPDAKVVMMTAFSVDQLISQALENGAMAVLSKPMEINRTLSALEKVAPNGVLVAPARSAGLGGELANGIRAAGRKCSLVRSRSWDPGELDKSDPAVVIFDLQEPLISGLEIYSRTRRVREGVQAIFVAEAPQIDEEAFSLDDIEVSGILRKPFDPVDLIGRLERLAA